MKGKYKMEYGEWSLQTHQEQHQNDQGTSMYQLNSQGICEANENTEGKMKKKKYVWGFPDGTKEPSCWWSRQEMLVWSPSQEDPWRAWQLTLVFLPGKSHGQRSLAGYSPHGGRESDMTEAT